MQAPDGRKAPTKSFRGGSRKRGAESYFDAEYLSSEGGTRKPRVFAEHFRRANANSPGGPPGPRGTRPVSERSPARSAARAAGSRAPF